MAKSATAKDPTTIAISYSSTSRRWTSHWRTEIGSWCDDLIPKEYKNELIAQSQLLIQDKSKLNYRNPDLTNKSQLKKIQIQDLIEPCHYNPIFFANPEYVPKTLDKKSSDSDDEDSGVLLLKPMGRSEDIPKPNAIAVNPYIPAIFELNKETNSYEIKSEINDLPRFKYPKLYEVIQNIFTKMVPKIETVLSTKYVDEGTEDCTDPSGTREFRNAYAPYGLASTESDESDSEDDDKTKKKSKKDKKKKTNDAKQYFVIVRMTDYQFMDKKDSSYGGGNLHSEGFDEDNIKSAALYYFDCQNVDAGHLSFEDRNVKWRQSSTSDQALIKDDRCMFFCNDKPFEHGVGPMKIKSQIDEAIYQDKNGNNVYGTRKLLAFFIIDPKKQAKMKSSADIAVNMETKIPLILNNWFRKNISIDIMALFMSFCGVGNKQFMKDKTDEYSRYRYMYGIEVMQYDEERRRNERYSMSKRRD